MIRPVRIGDAAAIAGIYNYYVEHTVISFEERPVSIHAMEGRIRDISSDYPWFVCEKGGEVLGYAYINRWKDRIAYRYSAEASIYLKTGYGGKGLGSALFSRLLEAVPKTGIHALVSGITLPNDGSVALHEKFGFTQIARFNEIGYKMDTWLDVGYWELVLKK
jgi:phosphinothricin acetyltransferase